MNDPFDTTIDQAPVIEARLQEAAKQAKTAHREALYRLATFHAENGDSEKAKAVYSQIDALAKI